jgi:nucleotide-binding universal stress UspA family protein
MSDRPILICYDGSEASDGAIDAAAELLCPRRAVVLNVGPVLTTAEAWAATSSVVPGNAFDDLNVAAARERADAGVEHARRAGFTAEARTELGAPRWESIVDVAGEIDAALIVIGSRGLTGARELFEGSTSHEVAEHAGRPVLIVPRRIAKEER